ncbi:uncharacterized protein [Montipora capricornis]|uniref:uncharacterized protein n=1 Tax=Montipora capricornis TaxID=246305 RepID=UPI0035F1DCF5
MESKEGEKSVMELCGGEEDDAENVEMSSELPATCTVRTRKPNPNNREEVEAEEIHRLRRSLSGYLSRELKRSVELKRLKAQQALELADYEAEMEKKKIDIEMQKQKTAKEMVFKAQLEAREIALLVEEEGDAVSCALSLQNETDDKIEFEPPITRSQQTATWLKKYGEETTSPHSRDPSHIQRKENFIANGGDNGENENCLHEKEQMNPCKNPQAILLKVTTLQAMQPVKFSGNAADFLIFRRRVRDNLEDGLLSDAQRIEFLPKFVSGKAYEVVERSVGCSYDDIIATLEERYGQPAAVAATCINMLTTGPKLGNRDFKGLRNFAEQLQCASRILEGEYEHEASTTSNMEMIVARLPDYIINKWADVSYSNREKGQNPKL